MPLSLIQAVIACGICSLVIRALGDRCRQQNGADGDDGRRPLQLNSIEICFPGRSSGLPHQNNPAAAQGWNLLRFSAAEHL
jgi:hypothetical protein